MRVEDRVGKVRDTEGEKRGEREKGAEQEYSVAGQAGGNKRGSVSE